MIKSILKSIHNFFLIFGINISFAKKNNNEIQALKHNSAEGMNKYYSDPVAMKNFLDPSRKKFYMEIIGIFKSNNIELTNKSVADVGCGTGHLLFFLSNEFNIHRITGYDFVEPALDIAKKVVPDGKFSVYDVYSEPEEKFDLVLCTEVLEHLLYPEKALQNLISMLLPGGVLFISVPNGRTDTYDGHINFWSPESWNVFLENNSNENRVLTGIIDQFGLFGIIKK